MALSFGAGPFPLPHVQVPRTTGSRSRRVQQRQRRSAAAAKLANSAISALNLLHTPNPRHTPHSTHSSNFATASSLRAVAHVQSCSDRFVSRLAPGFQQRALSDDTNLPAKYHAGNPSLSAPYASTTPALPLSADLVSLPKQGGFVNLLDLLPPDIAKLYSRPRGRLLRPKAERKTAPRAQLVRSPKDYTRIIRRLHNLTMVTFTTTPKVVNGVFATPKSNGTQRFVVDGRPMNAIFADSPKVELPTPDLLARLHVDKGQEIFVAKVDLDNFYHRIKAPAWMHPYFALPPVRAGDVDQGHVFGNDTLIYPCCTTLPMGWSHSAYLGQALHEHILDTHTSLSPANRITKHNDFQIDRPRHDVYIDDLNLFGRDPDVLLRLQDEYISACQRVGLTIKASKVVKPSSDGVECIGMEVHGRFLTCGVSPTKLDQLIQRTERVLRQDTLSGLGLASLVGYWTWVFLARRPAFAIFNGVYRYIDTAKQKVFQIWPSVRRELRLAIAIAPLLFSSLSAPWCATAVATDASSTGIGVVASNPPSQTMDTLAHEPLPQLGIGNPLPSELPLHPLLNHIRWRTIIASQWRWPEHINVLEARAMVAGVRWILSSPHGFRRRLLMFCDSLVVSFASRKGRSSSYPLLLPLRKLSALVLSSGLYVHTNYIASKVNPADAPSRLTDPQQATSWVRDLTEEGIEPNPGPPKGLFLFESAFAPATLVKYRSSVTDFLNWMDSNNEDPTSTTDMDNALVRYFHDMYIERDGKNRSAAEACKSGVEMYFPSMKGKLHGAKLALRGWRRNRPPSPHPPLTWDLAVLIACTIASRTGNSPLAISVLVAFDAYLRVGELTNLRKEDVTDSKDPRLGPSASFKGMALRLAKTKTGPNQWCEIRNPTVCTLLRDLVRNTLPGNLVFPFSSSTFRTHFKSACALRGLARDYVPHSLRHGGATRDFLAGVPLEEVLRRGRWASTKSARHYIQSGRSLLLTLETPSQARADARLLSGNVLQSLTLSLSQ